MAMNGSHTDMTCYRSSLATLFNVYLDDFMRISMSPGIKFIEVSFTNTALSVDGQDIQETEDQLQMAVLKRP